MTLANPQALVRRPSLGIAENSHADAGKKATAPRAHGSERDAARELRWKPHTPMRKKKRSHGSERATATFTNPQALVKGPSLDIAENSHADAGEKQGEKTNAPRAYGSERDAARDLRWKPYTPMRGRKGAHGSERATAILKHW